MPQMAPINWLSLFFMFCLTFIMFNLLNYFNFFIVHNTEKKSASNNKEMKSFNWKW